MAYLLPLIARASQREESEVIQILQRDPSSYRTFYIPKKDGTRRLISEPSPTLKVFQRTLTKELASSFVIHPAAFAYRTGLSIRDNALAHAHNKAIETYDFADFFPSLSAGDWHTYCSSFGVLDQLDIDVSARVFFNNTVEPTKWRLAMGAPSSPFVSNVLLAPFDQEIVDRLAHLAITYTRYADDLTFSAKSQGDLAPVANVIALALKACRYENLALNHSKTRASALQTPVHVTGIYIETGERLSVGYERKASVRRDIERARNGALPPRAILSLKGTLAFVLQVEPAFRQELDREFGPDQVEWIRRYQP